MARWGKNIYEIPVDPSKWRFFNPRSILLGMDGALYVKSTARTWHTEQSYNGPRIGNDAEPAEIRRIGSHAWEIRIPENEEINASDPLYTNDVWVEVALWEPPLREPLNRKTDGFAQLSTAMQNFGTAMGNFGTAVERLTVQEPLTAVPGMRRGSRVYHVNVVDRDTGKVSVLVMSESKYAKLLEIGGERLNQIVSDDMNADIQEDGTEEHLSIMSIIDNLYEPKGR